MIGGSTNHRELLLPLVEGIQESPPWSTFLRNLVARMYARRAFMIITLTNARADQAPAVIQIAAPRAAQEGPIDFHRLGTLGLYPYGSLRPGRVYSLEELLDYSDRARAIQQRHALAEMRMPYARVLRVSISGVADAWLVLAREREDFGGAAVATLDAVGAHLKAGLRTLAALIEQRLQTAMATSALARLGVGQLAFDSAGRVMVIDPTAETLLSSLGGAIAGPERRLNLRPEMARRLETACAAFAAGRSAHSLVLRIDESRAIDLLLRRADVALAEPCAMPAAIGLVRTRIREAAREALGTLAAVHGLARNEAALAHALSMGESLAEAGQRLRLSAETARNYSKRIYAKTGTRGQADLVRLVLTGLAPFA